MSEYGTRYDGKPFSESDYRIISGGGGDPDNDGVVTDREWSDWMSNKGATPGYEADYQRKINEIAAYLEDIQATNEPARPSQTILRSQPDPVLSSTQSAQQAAQASFAGSMSAPPKDYVDSTFDNPMVVAPIWDMEGDIINDSAQKREFELYGQRASIK